MLISNSELNTFMYKDSKKYSIIFKTMQYAKKEIFCWKHGKNHMEVKPSFYFLKYFL